MKKGLITLVNILIIISAWGQAPEKMSYQAVVRDLSSNLTINQSVGVQISILQGGATGSSVYVETQSATTNDNGLVSLEIGTGTLVSGDFSTINWANDIYFIKTETDPTGGTTYTITGTSQLMSVPYALHAKTADSITSTANLCNLTIGDTYQGGIIFYIDKTGCHGLVAKTTDEGNIQWKTSNSDSWAISDGIYVGAQNTKRILYLGGLNSIVTPAATACDILVDGGFDDWYLPSRAELDLMYLNLHTQGLGNFMNDYYWSSSESTSYNAYFVRFSNGFTGVQVFSTSNYVRAIRAF